MIQDSRISKKKRVFVGISFDEEARRGVEKVLKMLKRKHWPVRWEKPEKLHLTLAFLGWISESQVARVAEVVKAVRGLVSFTLEFKGLGGFPDLELPRVVWLGLRGDLKSLYGLNKKIRKELRERRIEYDDKPLVPHVTLGRVEKETRAKMRREIGKQLGKLRVMKISQQWRVDRVVVYESRLRSSGSEYHILKKVKLGV